MASRNNSDEFDLYEGLLPSSTVGDTTDEVDDVHQQLNDIHESSDWEEADKALEEEGNVTDFLQDEEPIIFASQLPAAEADKRQKLKSYRTTHRRTAYIRKNIPLFFGVPPILPTSEETNKNGRVVVIHNLAWWVNDIELRNGATEVGPVAALKIFSSPIDGRSTGMGLIEYMKRETAGRAVHSLQNKFESSNSRHITVRLISDDLIESMQKNEIQWSEGGPLTEEQLKLLFKYSNAGDMKIIEPSNDALHTTNNEASSVIYNGDASQTHTEFGEQDDNERKSSHPLFPSFDRSILDTSKTHKKRKDREVESRILDSDERQRKHKKKPKKKKEKHENKRRYERQSDGEERCSSSTMQPSMKDVSRETPYGVEGTYNDEVNAYYREQMHPHNAAFGGYPRRAWGAAAPSRRYDPHQTAPPGGYMPQPSRRLPPHPADFYYPPMHPPTYGYYPRRGYPIPVGERQMEAHMPPMYGQDDASQRMDGWVGYYDNTSNGDVHNTYYSEGGGRNYVGGDGYSLHHRLPNEFTSSTNSWQRPKHVVNSGHY